MKAETCCFTGHRNVGKNGSAAIRAEIRKHVLEKLNQGFTTFLVGGAMGFDMLCAEVLVDLREKEGKNLRLVSVLPFPDWRESWPREEYDREERILNASDEIRYSAEEHSRNAYLDRDRSMVDESGACLAWCTRKAGGTAYTIRYAMKQGIHVTNLAGWNLSQLKD